MQYTTEGFLAGIILFNADRATISVNQAKQDDLTTTYTTEVLKKTGEIQDTFVVTLGEPVLTGKKGEKKHKLNLELFNDKVLLLKVIDISHGVGHVVVSRYYFERKGRNEVTVNIKRK